MENHFFLGKSPLHLKSQSIHGEYLHTDGEKFYRIRHFDQMPPFFMSLVSADNHWMFLSSAGALSAGRVNPDNALFPYYTVDKIHDFAGITGNCSLFWVKKNEHFLFWEPFSPKISHVYDTEQNLYKNIAGSKVIFEEINHDLKLRFRYSWQNSPHFGFVRKAELLSLSDTACEIRMLDGIQNIVPYGINSEFQNKFSVLADAYKRNELLPEEGIGLYYLNSVPTDKAEPAEGLKATTVWSTGMSLKTILLSERQIKAFRTGQATECETEIRGQRGAYLLQPNFTLGANAARTWCIVADINQDAADLVKLRTWLQHAESPRDFVAEDLEQNNLQLQKFVASADGLQKTADEIGSARHFSNVLFNIMRGGLVYTPQGIPLDDFKRFLAKADKSLATSYASAFDALPKPLTIKSIIAKAKEIGDRRLIRIAQSYLPLIFSRRHGDPSRPWNYFSVQLKNEDGSYKYYYEGNWRDLFQNWEALAYSFPKYINNMITVFLNASTRDGYNPYRISSSGIDWEEPDPNDPWSNIGYWGDHQIVYLHKLLEVSRSYFPDSLKQKLTEVNYVFADVPYRIKTYTEINQNPYDTIVFDKEKARKIRAEAKEKGNDAKLVRDSVGEIFNVSLLEKLMLTALVKLSNYVPDVGIRLLTQRPEWNDANNALVGNGASVVTLFQLRAYLKFLSDLLNEFSGDTVAFSGAFEQFLYDSFEVFEKYDPDRQKGFLPEKRKSAADALGEAGSRYRDKIYKASDDKTCDVPTDFVQSFLDTALSYIDSGIASNKRADNLYHSYNLLRITDEGMEPEYLSEMLEGQAAVLASDILSPEESIQLLDALRKSSLFTPERYSYLLYPNKNLSSFVDKNLIPEEFAQQSRLMKQMAEADDKRLFVRDVRGAYHFNGSFRNAADLSKTMDELYDKGEYRACIENEKEQLLDIWENMFKHHAFTGRSGTFFAYEGLGSIYWHMVSKLLQAVGRTYSRAVTEEAAPEIIGRLAEHYYEIRAGIGMNKPPEKYGAFPSDPYSHTPAHSGAKQPGMTGQVKEDVISRFTELGIEVRHGKVHFKPALLRRSEFLKEETVFEYFNLQGNRSAVNLPAGSLAFTCCGVPVVYRKSDTPRMKISYSDGAVKKYSGNYTDSEDSYELFVRSGKIHRLDVFLSPGLE